MTLVVCMCLGHCPTHDCCDGGLCSTLTVLCAKIMANFRKKSTIKKPNIFDEIKVVKEEGQTVDSLEEIEEEEVDETSLPQVDFDPDDRDYDSIRLDPISTFTLSESDNEEDQKEDQKESEDFTVVSLKPNVDIEAGIFFRHSFILQPMCK